MTREGRHWPRLTFRNETEAWMFHDELRHVDTRATIWTMTEQLKVLKKYLDRQATDGQQH